MPLNAVGWTTEEDEKLIDLVRPHPQLYSSFDPSRKNILARVITWQEIANNISKSAEECKKRWRGLRDTFMRNRRSGKLHESKIPIYEKLQFLEEIIINEQANLHDYTLLHNPDDETHNTMVEEEPSKEGPAGAEQVITDNQEYYEIELVDETQQILPDVTRPMLKKMKVEPGITPAQPPKKVVKRNVGRKRSVPIPPNLTPVKILPKPLIPIREPKIVRCIETPKTLEQRSQTLDKLIEKVLKENTNEIDVFFRSMAASVKKLQPNLIPKVKMEVCNVIAKYEMQSFDKTS